MAPRLLFSAACRADPAGAIGRCAARLSRRCAIAPVFLLLLLAWPGCRAPERIEDGALVRLTARETRIDAFPGRALIVPVDLAPLIVNPDAADPDRPITGLVPVTLDDGRTLAGEVVRIGVRPAPAPRRRPWLETPAVYSARSAREYSVREAATLDPRTDPGFWAVLVDLPPDAARGDLRIAGERIGVVWREGWRAPRRAAPVGPVTPGQGDSLERFAPAARNPNDRWRLHLLADRRATRAPLLAPLLAGSLGHPALDALAQGLADRWRVAISLVGDADAELAGQLAATLSRVVSDGDLVIPAWPVDDDDAARLLARLLDPSQTPAGRAELARVWLDEQPGAIAWALDDAGVRRPGTGINPVRVGVAELRGRSVLAGAETPDGARGPRIGLAPLSVGSLVVAVPERDAPTFVRAVVGEEVIGVPIVASPAPAQPPGARLGPLSPERTMREWLAGVEASPDPEWAGAALLSKDPGAGVWRLYIECRTPVDFFVSTSGADDIVRVFLGASDAPASILRIRASGEVTDEVSAEDLSAAAIVTRERDRWTALLPIPASAIDPDGVLRIALERLDGAGGRATWPRALLPWRESPGRVAIDLTKWNELRE